MAYFFWPTFANKSVAKAMSKHAVGKISNVFEKEADAEVHDTQKWSGIVSLFFFFFKLGANAITNDTAL